MRKLANIIELGPRNLYEEEWFNFRDYRANRKQFGKYVEYVVLSLFDTCKESNTHFIFSDKMQDVKEHWDFAFMGNKYDITLNPNSKAYDDVRILYLDSDVLFDHSDVFFKNFVTVLNNRFLSPIGIELNADKLNQCNDILNQMLTTFLYFTKHKQVVLYERLECEAKYVAGLLKDCPTVDKIMIYSDCTVDMIRSI